MNIYQHYMTYGRNRLVKVMEKGGEVLQCGRQPSNPTCFNINHVQNNKNTNCFSYTPQFGNSIKKSDHYHVINLLFVL